jgi:hypothetical protein
MTVIFTTARRQRRPYVCIVERLHIETSLARCSLSYWFARRTVHSVVTASFHCICIQTGNL